jgi:hypothetical protein
MRSRLRLGQPLPAEWANMGVDVHEVAMVGRGSCSISDPARIVYVNRADSVMVQRFTVAHEVAHLLLEGRLAEAGMQGLRAEERLCDRFAAATLVPRPELIAMLDGLGYPPPPEDILRLCSHFRVNVRPMLFAVGELVADTDSYLLLARLRGHRARPAELAFRVEASAGARHVYLPREQRLASMGLRRLAAAAEGASHGDLISGSDPEVCVELRKLPGDRPSASVWGPVDWRACRVGSKTPYLVAVLDLSSLPGRGSP